MATSAVILVCVVALTSAHIHVSSGSQDQTPILPPFMVGRVDRLERLLLDQETRLSQQEEKLSQQDRLLRKQAENLLHQETILHQQKVELAETRTEQAETRTELAEIKTELAETKADLHQQNRKLSHQEALMSQQSAKLTEQERLVNHYGILLQRMEGHHAHNHSDCRLINEKSKTFLPGGKTNHPNKLSSLLLTNHHTLRPHVIMSRSDDMQPLEFVVSDISQHVTKINADVQAFKAQTDAELQSLKNANHQQDQKIQDVQSSTFVRWGSSQCGNFADLVYSGVVGGSSYSYSGSATNALCLTMSPVLVTRQIPSYVAYLYGAEYETGDFSHDKDPVCAVCRSRLSTTIMIPGTNICTDGWKLHYSGYLMAGYYTAYSASDYICVDSSMQSAYHSDADENGKLLSFTVTECGSLPCKPYADDKIVTCVVCGK